MPKTKAQTNTAATLVQVLEYMDGPQAVLLGRSGDRKIVAVAIEKRGEKLPFFGAEISLEQWERYRRGFVDLRFLFLFPRWKTWYFFDLGTISNKSVRLTKTVLDAFAEEHFVPDQGFFVYDHSEPIKSTETEGLATQKYKTDGIWDLPDFTEFYHKVTDLYVFHLSLKKFSSDATPIDQKRRIRESFMGQPLRGGSSYVNLYSGLASVQSLGERLSVGKLQYASPGVVDIRGRLDIFAEMTASLNEFGTNYNSIKEVYRAVYVYLAQNQLLKAEPDRFDNNTSISRHIKTLSDSLASALRIEAPTLIYDLTGKHSLRYAKVLLAHFRRLERYFMFFAEGRVIEPENIAPEE